MKAGFWVIVGLSTALLMGCNGSSKKGESKLPSETDGDISLAALKPSQEQEFIRYLKNGLYINRASLSYRALEEKSVDMATDTSASATPAPSASEADHSSTTTQEVGVDEADRIKYDGNYIYVAANESAYMGYILETSDGANEQNKSLSSRVRVLKKATDHSLIQLPDIMLSTGGSVSESGSSDNTDAVKNVQIKNLYLANQQLSVIYQQQNQAWFYDLWRPYGQNFNVALYDVSSPEQASQQQNFQFDGYLITSRRVGNTLYLVSSFSPQLDGIAYGVENAKERSSIYRQINALTTSELLPHYSDSAGNRALLVAPANCYLPQDVSDKTGYDSIVTLTAINLSAPNEIQSVCVNSQVQGVYASTQAVYLYGSDYSSDQAFIHQFSIANDHIAYSASGQVPGHFGWGQSQLRFSEYQDHLRVVTTKRTSEQADRFEHKLFILKANNKKELAVISQLPNQSQPQAIGKPNEDIYAVRYFGERAYVVTFERIDPLYVIDLADVSAPKIVGELEVTGYSSYLQPIGENLLFAVGREVSLRNSVVVEPSGEPRGGSSLAVASSTTSSAESSNTSVEPKIEPTPVENGVKVVLFDVSDPQQPLELGKKVFADAASPAEYDYHALTYLKVAEDNYRFSLPVQSWLAGNSKNQLALFEVDSNAKTLAWQGSVVVDDNSVNGYYSNYNDRSIIHGDVLYYLHGNYLWQSTWQQPEQVTGPY